MRGPVGLGERAGWGLLGALACLFPAAAAHAAAGGSLPGLDVLLLLFAGFAVPGALLSGSRLPRRFEAAVAVLTVLQLALHECFHRLAPMPHSGAGHDTGMAGMSAMPGMARMDMPAMPGGHGMSGMDGSMAAWHTVATVTSAVALIHGSRLLRRLAALRLRPRLPLLAALFAAPTLPAPPRPVFPEPGRHPIGVLLARSVSRRGPPVVRA
ncbi:hypothetical protein ACIRPK_34880 [Kitasatospora sp. NPDC101801]|uniref:hypothetical protein n=1 Tax=Kitasatospora sp. NPDC101801 TaxID=3364103 RepID=UPI0037FA9D9C